MSDEAIWFAVESSRWALLLLHWRQRRHRLGLPAQAIRDGRRPAAGALRGTAIQSPTKHSSAEAAASTAAPAGKALRFGNQIRSRPDVTTVRCATAKRTATASTLGRMAPGLMASTATTRRTATASTLGPMAADMMASGATVRR